MWQNSFWLVSITTSCAGHTSTACNLGLIFYWVNTRFLPGIFDWRQMANEVQSANTVKLRLLAKDPKTHFNSSPCTLWSFWQLTQTLGIGLGSNKVNLTLIALKMNSHRWRLSWIKLAMVSLQTGVPMTGLTAKYGDFMAVAQAKPIVNYMYLSTIFYRLQYVA